MRHGKRVAVVIPALNERARILRTVATVPPFVDHIVVVDDGSVDGTDAEARKAIREGVAVLRHAVNQGVGRAIATGVHHAVASGAEVIAVMAGDGQMAPEDLPRVLDPALLGEADFVKGNRLAHPTVRRDMPLSRWLGNQVLSWLTRVMLGMSVHDTQCGFVALSRSAVERLDLQGLWPRYGYPNDLLARLARAGLRWHEVPVRAVYAGEASGVRLHHALFVVPWVIVRGGWAQARGWTPAPQKREAPQP